MAGQSFLIFDRTLLRNEKTPVGSLRIERELDKEPGCSQRWHARKSADRLSARHPATILELFGGGGRFATDGTHHEYSVMPWNEKACGVRGGMPRILDPGPNEARISDYPLRIPPQFSHYPVTIWSQLSDSVFLDRVNSAKIPLFYGLVKHFSRTPPNPSRTPNLLAILLAIGYCERNCN